MEDNYQDKDNDNKEEKDDDKEEEEKKEKKVKKEKKNEGTSLGQKLLIGLGVTFGATAAIIGGKMAYDHITKNKSTNTIKDSKKDNKSSITDSSLEYKAKEEKDSILRKLKTQKSLKTKIVDIVNDNHYLRVNSLTVFNEKEKEEELKCPITQTIMNEPVITPYGTTYEKTAIIDWIKKNKTDFKTNKFLNEDMLIPNYILKVAIKNYKESLN